SFEISILSELQPLENNGERALLHQLQVGIDGLLLKNSYHSAIFLSSV
ncbi:MAG: AMMECR1 domain-containing protein, partial [Psychromonas sp.]